MTRGEVLSKVGLQFDAIARSGLRKIEDAARAVVDADPAEVALAVQEARDAWIRAREEVLRKARAIYEEMTTPEEQGPDATFFELEQRMHGLADELRANNERQQKGS